MPSFADRIAQARNRNAEQQSKKMLPCRNCGVVVVHTGDGKHPCSYCGGTLTSWDERWHRLAFGVVDKPA